MTQETWKELKDKAVLNMFYPGIESRPEDFVQVWHGFVRKQRQRAIRFIQQLLDNNISLSQIDINDFEPSSSPAVYVANRRYTRLARNDYKMALKHLQEKRSKVK